MLRPRCTLLLFPDTNTTVIPPFALLYSVWRPPDLALSPHESPIVQVITPTSSRITYDSPTFLPPAPSLSAKTWNWVCPLVLEILVWTWLSVHFGCISAEKPRNIMLRKGLVSLRVPSSLKKPVGNFFGYFRDSSLNVTHRSHFEISRGSALQPDSKLKVFEYVNYTHFYALILFLGVCKY